MSERQKITAIDLRDFFTMLPNMIDDSDLDVYEYRLLAHYYRVGNCWESTTTTALACTMSRPQVIAKRQSLCAKGWIRIKRGDAQDTLSITVVDKWVENHGLYAGKKKAIPPHMGEREIASQSPDHLEVREVTTLTGGGHVVDSKKNHIKKTYKNNNKITTTTKPAVQIDTQLHEFLAAIKDREGNPIADGLLPLLVQQHAGRLENVRLAVRKWQSKPGNGIGLLVRILQAGKLPKTEAEERRKYYDNKFSDSIFQEER